MFLGIIKFKDDVQQLVLANSKDILELKIDDFVGERISEIDKVEIYKTEKINTITYE